MYLSPINFGFLIFSLFLRSWLLDLEKNVVQNFLTIMILFIYNTDSSRCFTEILLSLLVVIVVIVFLCWMVRVGVYWLHWVLPPSQEEVGGGWWWVPTATLATNNGHNKSSDHCNKKSDWNIYFNIIIYIISGEPTYMYTVSSCCLCKWVWSLDTIASLQMFRIMWTNIH